jgi:hypothetical protein
MQPGRSEKILSPSPEAPAREAEPAREREREEFPDPSALYEIYWPYLWGEAVDGGQNWPSQGTPGRFS